MKSSNIQIIYPHSVDPYNTNDFLYTIAEIINISDYVLYNGDRLEAEVISGSGTHGIILKVTGGEENES